MGALAQLNAQKLTFGASSPLGQWLTNEINWAGQQSNVDEAVPTAAAATDAVHTLAEDTVDHTGGTFTLTIAIRQASGLEESFTTAAIAYNANAATIEGAIDTAATSASITGWTNGDISVAAASTDLQGGAVTLTFDGSSVDEANHTLTVFNDSMTGGTSPTTRVTKTTAGQTERAALAVLINYNIIDSGTIAEQAASTDSGGFVRATTQQRNVPGVIVKALCKEAAAEDKNNATYHSLEQAIWGQNDKAPAVEPLTAED